MAEFFFCLFSEYGHRLVLVESAHVPTFPLYSGAKVYYGGLDYLLSFTKLYFLARFSKLTDAVIFSSQEGLVLCFLKS